MHDGYTVVNLYIGGQNNNIFLFWDLAAIFLDKLKLTFSVVSVQHSCIISGKL